MRAGPWMALDEEKFERWQQNLLALLNDPKLARFARWRMGLGAHMERGEEILSISPHQITVPAPGGLRTAFMPQPAMQKGLYRGFRPAFWGMHAYDWLLPDRVSQRWVQSLIRPLRPAFEGFGLATLTAYPQTGGGGGNVTCDGYAQYYNASSVTFAALRGEAGTGSSTIGTDIIALLSSGTANANQFTQLVRGFASFDTSSLTSSATISAATLSLYGEVVGSELGTTALDIVQSTQAAANTLANSDFSNVGATVFGSIAYASFATGSYNSIGLNPSGMAAISKTGVTKLALLLDWDATGTFGGTWAGASANTRIYSYSADEGAGYAPKLVVTYTVPTLAMRRELSALGTRMGSRQLQG